MGNVLNSIIINKNVNNTRAGIKKPVFTIDTTGKVKPKEDKAKLLPSRIFGSPVEYVKDLKQDVVNIGRAAKGKANDHELGRINDLAMKLGSLGLAAYLAVKNPLKMSKAMEFVGFTTFFTSMALWPKLTIQAPLKARTGVDIHQKYIDSQGRKKMLYQDPQYVLTDLYSKEDLEKIGDKLGVNKNLPDRDNFIKQRAQKTALQGNTLWMMTAGFATPLMSALMCNRLEKPVNYLIEKLNLRTSQNAFDNNGLYQGFLDKLKQRIANARFNKFISKNMNKPLNTEMVSQLSEEIAGRANSAVYKDAVAQNLSALRKAFTIDNDFVINAVKAKIPASSIEAMNSVQKEALESAIKEGSLSKIAKILAQTTAGGRRQETQKLENTILKLLKRAEATNSQATVGDFANELKSLFEISFDFTTRKNVLDRFISERVGDKSGSYIANQWDRVGNQLMKALKLKGRDLKALSEGNVDLLNDRLISLAHGSNYDSTVEKLMNLINQYEETTGEKSFIQKVQNGAKRICKEVQNNLLKIPEFAGITDVISSEAQKGTLENTINQFAQERVQGAASSFYRLIQTLDLYKRIEQGSIKQQLEELLSKQGQSIEPEKVARLIQACKDIMLKATTTDHVEKLTTTGFNLSKEEYKIVMEVLFGDKAGETIKSALNSSETGPKIMNGFMNYLNSFKENVINWKNGMTPDIQRRVLKDAPNSSNSAIRNNLVGKSIKDYVKDFAQQRSNSLKWLKIFGISMAVLTGVTLAAGLLIGRKSKIEQQAEEESKVNG